MAMQKITMGLSLISFAAKLDTAIQAQESFKTLCVGQPNKPAHAPMPITMPKTCPSCDKITDYASLKKGLPRGEGFVFVEADEVAQARAVQVPKRSVQLVPVTAESFFANTAQGEKLYTVHVDASAAGQYALIVQAVEKHPDLAFISQYVPSTRAGLYVARVKSGILMLEERVRHENLKPLPASMGGTADPNFVTVLDQLLPTMVAEFDPVEYEDKYAAQLAALVAAKEATPGEAPAAATPVVTAQSNNADLLAKLQALASAAKAPAA